jgi:hypothetical protein
VAKSFFAFYVMFERHRKNNIEFVKKLYCSNDFEIQKYKFVLGNKNHDINIIKQDQTQIIFDDVLNVIEYKNVIVYCGLEMEEVSIDLTSDFRKFVYHFNKDDQLGYFFHYMKNVYKYEDEQEDEQNGIEFIVVLNDDELSQMNHKLSDAKKLSFKQLLKLE